MDGTIRVDADSFLNRIPLRLARVACIRASRTIPSAAATKPERNGGNKGRVVIACGQLKRTAETLSLYYLSYHEYFTR